MIENLPLFPDLAHSRAGITPRDYQIKDHDESFRLWDSGVVGVLTRSFTGSGKTLQSCLKADTWMQRSDRHYVLILSYEEQLVNQYVQEVIDYLGVTPGVEMAGQKVTAGSLPRITVASRASLLYHKEPTEDQIAELRKHGINDPGAAPREKISTLLRYLRNGVCVQEVADELARINEQPEAANGKWSRVHKFDWHFNWLLILDEAHKHAHHLKSVGPIIDWFDQNPDSRRLGQTATPKRSDGVSIGDKMFPGIALDYPLYKPDAPCGVLDGWAVPYVQRYIKVNGVDFKGLKKVAGDFDEGELGMVLGKEETLAALVEPLLDMAEDRRTLIFSPTVQMAKDVASYINARSRAVCTCGTMKWYPTLLIGDGAQCPSCQRMIDSCDVDINTQQAAEIDGETTDRTTIYKRHQKGDIQFLSICGLCVAKGTMILTDRGEVPIERVTTDMRLWDGVEFVSHDGVLSKGEKSVIQYAGLTATGDHNVWTDNGWVRLAACKQQGIAIRVSAIGGQAVRESCGYHRNDLSYWQVKESWLGSSMRRLWPNLCQGVQRAEGWTSRLQKLCEAVWCPRLVADAMSLCKEAVRESVRRGLSRLWRSRNRVPLCFANCNGTMGHGTHWPAKGIDTRPQGQQQTLRTRQSSVGKLYGASQQPEAEEARLQTSEVFDILNAGPRHRFTANGLIVSNCREGYNDREISCVAVFRPVSRKASALAEQMKGRGCRVLPGVVDGGLTKEQRLAAIDLSNKRDCIAKGTPILTDQGEVPIECVTTAMKVWDGVDFVTHSGIISRGNQRVIVYAGLAATPDHEVLIHDETNQASETEAWSTFGDCAAKQTPIRVTGFGGTPIREADRSFRRDYTRDRRGFVPPESARGVRLRSPITEGLLGTDCGASGLSEVRTPRTIPEVVVAALCGSSAAMPEPERQSISEVRRERDQVLLPITIGHGDLGSRQSGDTQGDVSGQEGQQRELRSWKPALRKGDRTDQQPARQESHARGPCVSVGASRDQILGSSPLQVDSSGAHLEADHRPTQQDGRDRHWANRPTEWEVEVFDILNAGPRHRFTAAGLLVSNCLIVDLVGITGLGDCASTVQIYSEGLPDEIQQRAEDILAEQGLDGEIGVTDAISQAKREDEDAKRRAKEERERAEQHARDQAAKRAKADAQVDYTTHDVGSQRNVTEKNEASEKMYRWIASLGMNIVNTKLSKRQAWRIADQLLSGEPAEMVAYTNGLDEENWEPCGPSAKQQYAIRSLQVEWVKCGTDASYVISAMKNPVEFVDRVTKDMDRSKTNAHLTTVAKRLVNTGKSVHIDPDVYRRLINYGQSCRGRLGTKDEF